MIPVAAAPLRLGPYPQKFRTFYALDDAAVPAELRREAVPLPAGGVTCAARASDGAVWLGTAGGLVRYDGAAPEPDRLQFFAGRRYLPGDEVLNLAPDAAAGVWARTRAGVSHIELRPMTLARKAAFFEQRIRERHDRYGLVADSNLPRPGDLASNQLSPSDNDGLWTAMYASAECFRYAATRSPDALECARRSIEAVLFLEQVTGRPGFPARSYIRKGDWRPGDGVWHGTPDGRFEWKADTSSDEIVGHFLIFGLAWDLLPDAALKRRVAATAGRIADHILDHHYYLTDVNGQPTYWGRWSPEYFASERGWADAPLNALELLSLLKTAHHVTGNARYEREYRKVALDMGYLGMTARLAERRREINYSDEELAMLAFYPVFRYEKDERFLAVYRRALEQWFQNMRRERNPLWNFIYAAAHPDAPFDLEGAVWTLNRIPMDLVDWTVRNSGRRDLSAQPLLPPDERPVMRWNASPFRLDGGSGGRREDDGAFFLLPYWLARYHGLIAESGGE